MAGRRDPGGILGLLDLIEEHRAAIRYDFRARFHVGLDSVPDVIGWDEALDLVRIIRGDPSSQLAAAVEDWSHPLSREGWMLADLIDIQGASKAGKKWNTYPRPIKPPTEERSQYGNARGQAPERVKELLRLAALGQFPNPHLEEASRG